MDDVDRATDTLEDIESDRIARIRRAAAKIPEGEEGFCECCGEYFARTVGGLCGYCRDREQKRARLWAA